MTKTDEQAQKWLDKLLETIRTFKTATDNLKAAGIFLIVCMTLCMMGAVVLGFKGFQTSLDFKSAKLTTQSTSQNPALMGKTNSTLLETNEASRKRCQKLSIDYPFFQRLILEINQNRERWLENMSQDELLNHIGKLSLKSRRDLGSYDKRKYIEFKATYGMADKRFHRLFPEYRGNEIQLEEVEVSQLWLAVLNDELAQ